jgi:manganese transport protein
MHNLYLHSSLVQTRKFDQTKEGIKQALKYISSTVALNLAHFGERRYSYFGRSHFTKLGCMRLLRYKMHTSFLQPLLGTKNWAPILFHSTFGSRPSSTITGTLAGQNNYGRLF